jgi:hypothetical protein
MCNVMLLVFWLWFLQHLGFIGVIPISKEKMVSDDAIIVG